MNTTTMYDAAEPANIPAAVQVVAGYLASGNDLHTWAAADWERFRTSRKLPIWEHNPGNDGAADAWAALQQLCALGAGNSDEPVRGVIALAMEDRKDDTYVTGFGQVCNFAGWHVWVNGSTSTLFQNPMCQGYWPADPDNEPHLYDHEGVRATQWAFGDTYDTSEIRDWTISLLWL